MFFYTFIKKHNIFYIYGAHCSVGSIAKTLYL